LVWLHLSICHQNYNAKLSDFGLAKDGPTGDKSHVSTRVMGTFGYAAPEYLATGTDTYTYLFDACIYVLIYPYTNIISPYGLISICRSHIYILLIIRKRRSTN